MSRCPVFLAAWSLALMSAAAAVSCRPTIALAEPPAAGDDRRPSRKPVDVLGHSLRLGEMPAAHDRDAHR